MIREVCADDAHDITQIYNHFIAEGVETFETEPLSRAQMEQRIAAIAAQWPYYVWTDGKHVAGYCYAHPWKERAAYAGTWETTVYVAPENARQGIGTALMRRLIDECRQRGCSVLVACITGCNTASIELHRRLGFTQASHFHNVGCKFGRRLDIVDYELQLVHT